jgi:hypothetical protein
MAMRVPVPFLPLDSSVGNGYTPLSRGKNVPNLGKTVQYPYSVPA